MISKSPAEQIVDLYERYAEQWDRVRGRPGFEKPWLKRFLALLSPGAPVLDVGCGSGESVSRYLIEKGFHVTGVDSSPSLIRMCESRFPQQEWIVIDMRKLSLDRRFDGILAWDSFFHLTPEDQRTMFPIFRKHAAPGAALMFTSGIRHGEIIATFQGEPLYHGSLDEAEYRSLLSENGFDVVSYVAEDPKCGWHTIWLAQLAM